MRGNGRQEKEKKKEIGAHNKDGRAGEGGSREAQLANQLCKKVK